MWYGPPALLSVKVQPPHTNCASVFSVYFYKQHVHVPWSVSVRQSVVFTVAIPLSKRKREIRRVSGNTSSIDARPSIDVTTYNLNLDPGLHPYWTITTAMEELHHDDRTAECQLPPSRGTSRPRAAAPILHQPCQDQTREGGHAGSRGSLMAALPGDDGDPAANPVHQPPSGRANQPRAAEQRAPFPSAAACTHAGRKTEGPLYGAAAPGGVGRAGLLGTTEPSADRAVRLPQPSGPYPAILWESRPVTFSKMN